MEYITAQSGERMLCLEKERVAEIQMKPEIWRVPGAPEEVLGIALYEQSLVIYYKFAKNSDAACGILVLNDAGGIYGIAADSAGEESLSTKQEETLIPTAAKGVWEKKND